MTNNSIYKLWEIIEEEKNMGLVKRLYPCDTPIQIYATLRYPEINIGIAFSFNKEIRINTASFENLKGLRISLHEDSTFVDSKLLVIQLLDSSNRDIFAILCENLIQSITIIDSEQKIIRSVINQLVKWKTLFDKEKITHLSNSEQQGLYGELQFLEKNLQQTKDSMNDVLHTWVGIDAALRDFQGASWAVEVKTTATNDPKTVKINGERQLDETLLDKLFLYHLSVEVSNGNGITLPQKIDNICQILKDDIPALLLFKSKLFEVGYFDIHKEYYRNRYYKTRNENFYRIKNDFPRIKENELRSGVCEIQYNITLSMCDEYLVTESQVFNEIQVI